MRVTATCTNPQCQKVFSFNAPDSAGRRRVACPYCKMINEVFSMPKMRHEPAAGDGADVSRQQVFKPTEVSLRKAISSPLILTYGTLFHKKSFTLDTGCYYLGRADEETPSDISIDDRTVSRRSLRIDVALNADGYVYKLTVERAANPVYCNKMELRPGDIIFLNPGDTLTVGRTALTLRQQSI